MFSPTSGDIGASQSTPARTLMWPLLRCSLPLFIVGLLLTALYLTVAIMDDAHAAETAIHVYLHNDYGASPATIREVQAWFGGPLDQVLALI